MPDVPRGLYEILTTEAFDVRLREIDARLQVSRAPLQAAEAADRFALQLARVIQRAIDGVNAEDRVAFGVGLARPVIDLL